MTKARSESPLARIVLLILRRLIPLSPPNLPNLLLAVTSSLPVATEPSEVEMGEPSSVERAPSGKEVERAMEVSREGVVPMLSDDGMRV